MRVEGPKRTSVGAGAKKAGSSTSTFQLTGEASTSQSQNAGSAASVGTLHSLDAILALQAVDADGRGRQRAIEHGHDLLDQLESLRADLLAGHVSPQRVGSLLGLIRARQDSNEPQLTALIDEIALRARVELAKLGVDL